MTAAKNNGSLLPHHRLVVYRKALDLLEAVQKAQIRDAKLRDEALRAAKGTCLNHPKSSTILEHSLEVVELARPVVEAVNRRDRDLASWFFNHSSASQLRRAISSVSLNLAEGFGCTGGSAPRAV